MFFERDYLGEFLNGGGFSVPSVAPAVPPAPLTGEKPLSTATRKAYGYAIGKFRAWHLGQFAREPEFPVEQKIALSYLQSLADAGMKPATLSMAAAAIRHECATRGADLSTETLTRVRNATAQHGRHFAEHGIHREQKGPPLRPDDMAVLLSVVDRVESDHRIGALFALMWAGALRATEAVMLRPDDVALRSDHVAVLLRRTKGGSSDGEVIEAHDYGDLWGTTGVRERLAAWLSERPEKMRRRANPNDRLFLMTSRKTLSAAAARYADLTRARMTTHSFRIGFAVTMAEAGVPLPLLQKQMRHANPQTTAEYYRSVDMGSVAAGIARVAMPEKTGAPNE